MPAKIIVLDRQSAARYKPKGYSVLFSIYDLSEAPLSARPGWVNVLRLRFHDADPSIGGLEHFGIEHVNAIVDFVGSHVRFADFIVIHCHHGRSRSAALGMVLSEKFHLPCVDKNDIPVTQKTHPGYNRMVYSGLMKAF